MLPRPQEEPASGILTSCFLPPEPGENARLWLLVPEPRGLPTWAQAHPDGRCLPLQVSAHPGTRHPCGLVAAGRAQPEFFQKLSAGPRAQSSSHPTHSGFCLVAAQERLSHPGLPRLQTE